MNRSEFLSLGLSPLLFGCIDEIDDMISNPALLQPGLDLTNTVFLLSFWGQSNAVGHAEGERIIALTEYMETPQDIKIYYKTDYTTTDNGTFEAYFEGSFLTREPPSGGPERGTGAYGMLATLVKKVSTNPVYIIMCGDGGTSLEKNQTTPDWNETETGECFDIFTNRYYEIAYPKIEAEQPGKNIVPIIVWMQGEADALNGTSTANYSTNFGGSGKFVDSLRASHSSLEDAVMFIVSINYLQTANEDTINQVFQDYADANPSIVKYIDISDTKRKTDLTTDEKGGISPTVPAGGPVDDEHLSYLAQQAVAERIYAVMKSLYFPTAPDSENLTNTGFDPTTISGLNVRLQFTRSKVTVGALYSIITAVTNDGGVGTFSTITNSPRFKVDARKGRCVCLQASSSRIQSSAAIGTTLFQNATGFSVNFFMRPRDGQPAANEAVFHDIASTGSPNNSRLYFLLLTSGKIQFVFAQGGTAKTFQTTNVIFANSNGDAKEKHIAWTMNNSSKVAKIYVNGVDQALDNSDFTGTSTGSYTNGTNVFTLFAIRTGASTYGSHYNGQLREFQVHTGVVYTAQNVLDLGQN